MAKKQVMVRFVCFNCRTENVHEVEVETGDTVKSFNMRRERVYEVGCSHCGSKNSARADA